MTFTIVEMLAAVAFVASSGIFFNERFRRNRYLIAIAGLIAIVSTYFLTAQLVDTIVTSRLAARSETPITVPSAENHGERDHVNLQSDTVAPDAPPSVAGSVWRGSTTWRGQGSTPDQIISDMEFHFQADGTYYATAPGRDARFGTWRQAGNQLILQLPAQRVTYIGSVSGDALVGTVTIASEYFSGGTFALERVT